MEELDLLKKDWKKREKDLPRVSYDEIYQMILRKSSSNIKWIFIISCIELGLGLLATAFYHPSSTMQEIDLPLGFELVSWLTFPVIIYFIYRFFRNYQKVSAASSVNGLLNDIIRSRKTVKHYIIFNLVVGGIMAFIAGLYTYAAAMGGWDKFKESAGTKEYVVMILVAFLVTAFIIAMFLGIYYLLYGILMRRLRRNYKELKQIDL